MGKNWNKYKMNPCQKTVLQCGRKLGSLRQDIIQGKNQLYNSQKSHHKNLEVKNIEP
jgi:hypothetical protein